MFLFFFFLDCEKNRFFCTNERALMQTMALGNLQLLFCYDCLWTRIKLGRFEIYFVISESISNKGVRLKHGIEHLIHTNFLCLLIHFFWTETNWARSAASQYNIFCHDNLNTYLGPKQLTTFDTCVPLDIKDLKTWF